MTPAGKMIEYQGRLYHDKTIRTKYNGELKPFAQKIKNALDGGGDEASWVKTKGKHIYTYEIKRKFKVKEQSSVFGWKPYSEK